MLHHAALFADMTAFHVIWCPDFCIFGHVTPPVAVYSFRPSVEVFCNIKVSSCCPSTKGKVRRSRAKFPMAYNTSDRHSFHLSCPCWLFNIGPFNHKAVWHGESLPIDRQYILLILTASSNFGSAVAAAVVGNCIPPVDTIDDSLTCCMHRCLRKWPKFSVVEQHNKDKSFR